MGSKTLTLSTLKVAQRDEGKAARARVVQKRKGKSPVMWLGVEWKSMMKRCFPEHTVKWTGTEAGLVKKLVDERGYDNVLKLFVHFFDTWERRKVSRKGVPGLKLLWVMRDQLDAEIAGRGKVPELRETKIKSGEYSEEAAAASPSLGWGEIDDSVDEAYEDGGDGW